MAGSVGCAGPRRDADIRRLETSAPIGVPVAVRFSGNDVTTLREQADKLKQILHATGMAARVRDDLGEDALALHLTIDKDKAALAGLTERDVANAASAALDGVTVGSMHDADHVIPIVMRLSMEERSRLSDLANIYVYSPAGNARIPLADLARVEYKLQPARIARYQQFRTITVSSFPGQGHLPSELLMAAMPKIKAVEEQLPPGIRMEIAGEYKEQNKGFKQIATVMVVSVLSIFLALVVQFRSAVKPLIVFAAIPFGVGGGLPA